MARRSVSLRWGAFLTIAALFVGGGAITALAIPGDNSHASAQFLSGTLINLDAGLVAALAGETAASAGTVSQTNANNLNVGVLGNPIISLPGGIQVPLNLASAGIVSQYASALNNGSSIGASGLVSDAGAIGTGITPAPGVSPGPLSVSLSGVVSSLGLAPGVLAELASLNLNLGVISGRAAQAAPGAASGTYEIVGANLTFTSATAAAFAGTINSQVSTLQTSVDGLDAALTGTLDTLLGSLGVATTTLTVSNPSLAAAVGGLTTGIRSDPAFPGVTVNLGTGAIAVDLNQIQALNGLSPNSDILSPAVITEIGSRVLGVLSGVTTDVETVLLSAVNGITVVGGSTILGIPVLSINTTVGALLAGSPAGITLLGIGIGLVGGVTAVVAALVAPLNPIIAGINAISDTSLAPVINSLVPALTAVLTPTLSLTGNAQSTAAGIFTETALRVTLLPGTGAFTMNVGSASVGPNDLLAVPALTTLTPDNGPSSGGTALTITGSGFTGASSVTIDGVSVAFTIVSDTEITTVTLGHVPGLVPVVVTNPAGPSLPLDFTFNPITIVSSVVPSAGPLGGGNTVTITGECFTGATGVQFGASPATSFTVLNDTTITAVVPPGSGIVSLTVVGSLACGTGVLPSAYSYVAAAVLVSLSPDHGSELGGTTVTLTGTGFTAATGVTFDGTPGTGFTIVSDIQITAITPAHAPGAVGVVVVSPGGNSAPLPYVYDQVPVITSLAPNHGPQTGGTAVTITGTAFTGATQVTIDGTPIVFVVVDDTTITFTTSAHLPAAVPVVVTTGGGASLPQDFTFDPVTLVSTVAPGVGPLTGGNTVTITGQCFVGATAVLFGATPATSFTVVNDTTITAVVPAGTGTVNVTVNGTVSCGNGTLLNAYEYLPPAVITTLVPDHGPETGGTSVTITGTGFTGATAVTFDGTAGTVFTVVNDTQITITSPAHVPGAVDVIVLSPGGNSSASPFTFTAIPVVTGLVPDRGPIAGGTLVTITGSGFTGATAVTFDGAGGTSFTVVSDTQITVTSPAHAAGVVEVVVVSPNGNSLPAAFTYVAPPVITGLVPDQGPIAGGTLVTITGSGFTGATGVTLDGTPGTSFTVVSGTQITVTSPAHAAGVVEVVVVSPNGNSLPAAFTYVAPPVVTGLVPDSGPQTGGTSITITGSGFTGATRVTIDGANEVFSVVSDTTVTVTTTAHSPGLVALIVFGPGGESAPMDFTFTPVTQISQVDPPTGPTTGMNTVTITGQCFTGATGVRFGLNSAISFTVINDTTITAVVPAGTGIVGVTILGSPTCGDGTLDNGYEYVTRAVIAVVTPSTGDTSGGTRVTITGQCFSTASNVLFGDKAATNISVVSDSEVTAASPAGTGTVDVRVVTGQCGTAVLTAGFRYTTPGLAYTGLDGPFAGLIGLLLMLVVGGALLLGRTKKSENLTRGRHA